MFFKILVLPRRRKGISGQRIPMAPRAPSELGAGSGEVAPLDLYARPPWSLHPVPFGGQAACAIRTPQHAAQPARSPDEPGWSSGQTPSVRASPGLPREPPRYPTSPRQHSTQRGEPTAFPESVTILWAPQQEGRALED